MADLNGYRSTGLSNQLEGDGVTLSGLSVNADAVKPVPNQVVLGVAVPTVNEFGGVFVATGGSFGGPHNEHNGYEVPGPHQYWFEFIHFWPLAFELGNILATIVRDIEVYNAYRESSHDLTAAVVNVDSGVTFQNLPGLPETIASQNSLIFQVRVTTDGPPEIEGTLDFTMDTGSFAIPVTGVRVVMFSFEPESPLIETLEWRTQVLEATDGTEQRISNRKHPRQAFEMSFKLEDESTRRLFQSLLYGFQPGSFGVPIWSDARLLTQAVTVTDTTIYLDTQHADFREQSLVIIWKDAENYDALEVDSLTSSSLTFSSPVQDNYAIGETLVMPLRVAVTGGEVQVDRHLVNLDEVRMRFSVLENETDIADDSGYDKHNGFVLLDDANMVAQATLGDSLVRKQGRLDNLTAPVLQYSDWISSRFRTSKGWVCNTSQQIWEVRQLVHALRGSQVSFYLPTFYHDLVIAATLSTGSFLMDIEYIGYHTLVQHTEPNASVWIELNDGTIITREVVDSMVLTATVERLTVDNDWDSTITPSEIKRVSFLRLCRIADDMVSLVHGYSGQAHVNMQVLAVQS